MKPKTINNARTPQHDNESLRYLQSFLKLRGTVHCALHTGATRRTGAQPAMDDEQ